MKRLFVPAAFAAAALLFAACGGGGGSSGSSMGSSSSRDTATTVATKRVDGKAVLVDAAGKALYTSDQEAGGMVKCTRACLHFWDPLTIQGSQPTGMVNGGTLGVLTRPDGKTQVAVNGDPVYRFAEDQSGSLKGDGVDDAFGGQQFTWHAVTTGAEPQTPATTSGSGGGTPGY